MTFQEFIGTITPAELDFIARLDYGQDFEEHRKTLDLAIANGGVVDTAKQGVWFPLEVIDLGKNCLLPGHEREYALCMGIVLQTGSIGDEAEQFVDSHMEEIKSLPDNLRKMLEEMIMKAIDGCEQSTVGHRREAVPQPKC
jgi:hypothetical protein